MQNKRTSKKNNDDDVIKKKISKKNVSKNIKRQQAVIQYVPTSEDVMQLSAGITINSSGVVKFAYQTSHVSYGDLKVQSTKLIQNEQIFQICFVHPEIKQKISVEEALEYILHTPCPYILEAKQALLKFQQMKRFLFNIIESSAISKDQIQQHSDESQKYLESCNQYIAEYASNNEEKMFYYQIGSVKFQEKDFHILQSGFSKPFLDLVGLNPQNLSFLLLRNQKIDLFKNKDDFIKQSLLFLGNQNQIFETKTSFLITTFDGFDIRLQQTKKQVFPTYKPQLVSNLQQEHILFLIEFDVELEDLKNLIQYRQKIISKEPELTFDEYVKKELSLMFENVEYSVLSQQFINKFYEANIDHLQKIEKEKEKEKKKNKTIDIWQTQSNLCKYKSIL